MRAVIISTWNFTQVYRMRGLKRFAGSPNKNLVLSLSQITPDHDFTQTWIPEEMGP